MRLPVFFIERPVFATIINIVIIVVGLLAIKSINLREYPDIATPEVMIRIPYPNASPEVIESEITFTAEDELASINGLDLMTSTSEHGTSIIRLKFSETVNFSKVLSDVREKIAVVRSKLPKGIEEPKIIEAGANTQPFYYISVINGNKTPEELSHFAELNLKNNFRSIPGVASVQIWGPRYLMDIKLNRDKMYLYRVNASEVLGRLGEYAHNLSAGKINETIPVTVDIASTSPEDFSEIIIKKNKSGNVKLKDIADIKLKGENDFRVRVNQKPALIVAVTKSISSNPLEVSNLISKRVEQIKQTLPMGYEVNTELDKTDFIRASLENVKHSIIEAIILVVVIIFLFLRNIRAALIPLITIPICLAGTVAILKFAGFSLNTLTLLAMVLSIGLVVDDAIVILENIYKHLEAGETPFEAAKKGSREIGFAVVAMTFTLTSVFIPIAFIEGSVGKLFIEFAVALAGSVIISGVVALTLSPMIAARVLKRHEHNFLEQIDTIIHSTEEKYKFYLAKLLPKKLVLYASLILIIVAAGAIYYTLPREIAPKEDRGFVGVFITQMANMSLDQLEGYSILTEKAIRATKEIQKLFLFTFDGGSYVVTKLKDWENRDVSSEEVRQEYGKAIKSIPSVQAFAWSWDSDLPGMEFDMRGGIQFVVKSTSNYYDLLKSLEQIKDDLKKIPIFDNINYELELNSVGYDLKFNKSKLTQLGIQPKEVSDLLAIAFDSIKSETFLKDGISYDVKLSSSYRPETIDEIYIFNKDQKLISVGSFSDLAMVAKAKELTHYNQMRSAFVNVDFKPDVEFSEGLKVLTKYAKENQLPGVMIEFGESVQKFLNTYAQMILLILLSVFFIYAILAVQFESFIDPLIIIFTVPLGCFGALLLTKLSGNSMNIFSQIGIVTLIGLLAKHGIMIVEFANQIVEHEKKSYFDAVVEAAKLRLRPILMTTFAMIFGSIPLILSVGAGAEARNAIGYVLVGGLAFGTLFTVILIPFMYVVLKRFNKKALVLSV